MKISPKCFILLGFSVIFLGCNKSIKVEERVHIGIDPQILTIVDSMQTCPPAPFITILFSMCNDSNSVILLLNGVPIPAPLPPPAPVKERLISEEDGFQGYKKYGNIYLVFIEYYSAGNFEKFIDKDSLSFDESPFREFNAYNFDGRKTDCDFIEKKYLITEKDSLIYYDGRCEFEID